MSTKSEKSPTRPDQPREHTKRTEPLKTVDNALNVLDFLGRFGGQVGVRELAEYLGINKSSTHRLLTTLERHGYVSQDPITGKYQLGMKLFEAGNAVLSQMNLRVAARPHLESLAEMTGEVVHLAVESRNHCVYVDKISGHRAIATASQMGWRKPLYCTGVGKILLAFLPATRIQEIVRREPLKALTPNTITDPDQLMEQLAQIRESGVAYDNEEIENGLSCIAAPVEGPNGRVVAAISISAPTQRFSSERREGLLRVVLDTAHAISKDLSRPATQPIPPRPVERTSTS